LGVAVDVFIEHEVADQGDFRGGQMFDQFQQAGGHTLTDCSEFSRLTRPDGGGNVDIMRTAAELRRGRPAYVGARLVSPALPASEGDTSVAPTREARDEPFGSTRIRRAEQAGAGPIHRRAGVGERLLRGGGL